MSLVFILDVSCVSSSKSSYTLILVSHPKITPLSADTYIIFSCTVLCHKNEPDGPLCV